MADYIYIKLYEFILLYQPHFKHPMVIFWTGQVIEHYITIKGSCQHPYTGSTGWSCYSQYSHWEEMVLAQFWEEYLRIEGIYFLVLSLKGTPRSIPYIKSGCEAWQIGPFLGNSLSLYLWLQWDHGACKQPCTASLVDSATPPNSLTH